MQVLKEREKSKTTLKSLFSSKKQKIQYEKTIDDLAPIWSEYFDLKTNNHLDQAQRIKDEFGLDIQCGAKCVIGEVYGFGWKHLDQDRLNYCKTCRAYSYGSQFGEKDLGFLGLNYNIQTRNVGRNWRNDPTVKGFLEHWNTIHVNK